MNMLRWVGVDMLTGNIVADLPDIEIAGTLPTTIGQPEQATVTLHLTDATNPDWLEATQPGGSVLIAYTGDVTAPTIAWGGIVQQRVRDTSPVVQLALTTPESYLDACYVGDYTATNANQDSILATLMAFASGAGQWPITLNHLPNASTQTQSVAYTSSSQTTILSALQALSALQGGPEWTMGWSWNTTAGTITPVLSYGARIGQPVLAGSQPNVTLESTDLMASAFSEDYSSGQGANQVICYGSASASASSSVVPTATATATNTKGRPLWAYAFQPNSTVSDSTTLANYAIAALTAIQDGTHPLSMTIPLGIPGKQLGLDWGLGDDIGWNLTGPAFPTPITGVARCVGYQVDQATITPVLTSVGP